MQEELCLCCALSPAKVVDIPRIVVPFASGTSHCHPTSINSGLRPLPSTLSHFSRSLHSLLSSLFNHQQHTLHPHLPCIYPSSLSSRDCVILSDLQATFHHTPHISSSFAPLPPTKYLSTAMPAMQHDNVSQAAELSSIKIESRQSSIRSIKQTRMSILDSVIFCALLCVLGGVSTASQGAINSNLGKYTGQGLSSTIVFCVGM